MYLTVMKLTKETTAGRSIFRKLIKDVESVLC